MLQTQSKMKLQKLDGQTQRVVLLHLFNNISCKNQAPAALF